MIMNIFKKITFIALILCAHSIYCEEKTAVFIIGMGRSGTSCTAGVLQILGLELGSPLAASNPHNKKGKFEHVPTNKFMQPILKEFNTKWWKPRLIQWDTVPQKNRIKEQVKQHLNQYFGEFSFFGIKNPEISILLPLFVQAAQELGYTPKIIMVLRHPDETNASMQAHLGSENKMYLTKDFYRDICLAYACVLKHAQDLDMHILFFSDLIDNPEKAALRLKAFLPQLKDFKSVQKEIKEFIDKGLKHQNAKNK